MTLTWAYCDGSVTPRPQYLQAPVSTNVPVPRNDYVLKYVSDDDDRTPEHECSLFSFKASVANRGLHVYSILIDEWDREFYFEFKRA